MTEPVRHAALSAFPAAPSQESGRAIIVNGEITIRIPVANLPMIVEGAWAAGAMDTRFKVTDPEEFAADLVVALNRESETGTTRIHKLFDGAIEEAIDQGARGIEESRPVPPAPLSTGGER